MNQSHCYFGNSQDKIKVLCIFPDHHPIEMHFLILFPHSPHFTSAELEGFIFRNVTKQDNWRNSEQVVRSGPAKAIHSTAPRSKVIPLFLPRSRVPELSPKPLSLYNIRQHSQFRERVVKSRAALIMRSRHIFFN